MLGSYGNVDMNREEAMKSKTKNLHKLHLESCRVTDLSCLGHLHEVKVNELSTRNNNVSNESSLGSAAVC